LANLCLYDQIDFVLGTLNGEIATKEMTICFLNLITHTNGNICMFGQNTPLFLSYTQNYFTLIFFFWYKSSKNLAKIKIAYLKF